MSQNLRRRVLLGAGALLAAPFVCAQAVKVPRICWLSVLSEQGSSTFLDSFLQGMAALDYVEGRNFVLDARYGNDSREALYGLAAEAASHNPAVFVTQGPGLLAARRAPGEIPVVFGFSGDPVELGVAQSLARPGGRFTGVTFLAHELSAKRVDLMHEVLPKAKRLAVLSNPTHVGDRSEFSASQTAAVKLGLEVTHHPASTPMELQRALSNIAAARSEAIVIHPDGLMVQQREVIARFSAQNRIPAISGWASIAEGGILMTYGPILEESYRRLAAFVDRILRGEKPANLPIELPAKLEMVVNLRFANAVGIAIPQTILLRADRVIG